VDKIALEGEEFLGDERERSVQPDMGSVDTDGAALDSKGNGRDNGKPV